MPESMHMIMWILSDRALPRSFRMMQGFGVHTFRFVNDQGKFRFVKFHWKPLLGVHSLLWDESQKLAGKDPDFSRRDLWDAIDIGDYPEFELGVQIIEEEDELNFDFDILDCTKLIPEELVPVKPIGKMVLNRNPDNFFAETEQVAFQPSNIVSGIDFSNDPMLQSRLHSYMDTQTHRLGSANYTNLPINRAVCPVNTNERDGVMQTNIYTSKVNYTPNSLGGGCPMMTPENMGGFVHYAERVEGHKIRDRSSSFQDHFSQATLFLNSMSEVEREHIVKAAHFELGKVQNKEVKERVLGLFAHIDLKFAQEVAAGLGLTAPAKEIIPNHGQSSPALSIDNMPKDSIKSRQVAILATDGVNGDQLAAVKQALAKAGAHAKIVSKHGGKIKCADGKELDVERTFLTAASVMFDAVYVPGGAQSINTLKKDGDAIHFISEAFKHCKAIAASGEGVELFSSADLQGVKIATNGKISADKGVVTYPSGGDLVEFSQIFIDAIMQHRHWMRTKKEMVSA